MRPSILTSFLVSLVIVVGLGFVAINLRPNQFGHSQPKKTLRVYCASGIANPVEQAIQYFNSEFNADVEIARTGGSGELAGQIKTEFETEMSIGADIYLSADEFMMNDAHSQGIVFQRFWIATQKPVIAVLADSELEIENLKQMLKIPALKFGIASERAAIGRVTRKIAKQEGVLDQIELKKTLDSENVMTLAQALVSSSLHAAIVWDATVEQVNQQNDRPVLKIASLVDASGKTKSRISAGIISRTDSTELAKQFLQFLVHSQHSHSCFENSGFRIINESDQLNSTRGSDAK